MTCSTFPADRKHAKKRYRPFASGRVSIVHGLVLAIGLIGTALGLAAALSTAFFLLVLLYAATCLTYSFRLKRIAIVDVLCLAGLSLGSGCSREHAWRPTSRCRRGCWSSPCSCS